MSSRSSRIAARVDENSQAQNIMHLEIRFYRAVIYIETKDVYYNTESDWRLASSGLARASSR
jgi:hypothetical protein